jgi:hypothetical protein
MSISTVVVHIAMALRTAIPAHRHALKEGRGVNNLNTFVPLQVPTTLHSLYIQKTYTILVLGVVVIGVYANLRSWLPPSNLVGLDINYVFIEGQRIRSGENPYSRILAGNMADNQKYATYFPAYYELAALTQTLGLREFEQWVLVWRVIFLIFNVAVCLVLFFALDPKSCPWLALGAAGFWLLNRWTLEVSFLAHIDFPAVFFLVLAIATFKRTPNMSPYYLGISLTLKQIGIFVVPLYMAVCWATTSRTSPSRGWKMLGICIKILVIPALAAVPFLFWDPEGFAKSIFFSFTRNPGTDFLFDVPSAGEVLDFRLPFDHFGLNRQLLRLPMLVFMGLSYVATLRGEMRLELGSLLVMAVFVGFNPVFFSYYMVWIVALIPLAARGFCRGLVRQRLP